MALKSIGTKLVIEGEKEYKRVISSINLEQKALAAEMKLSKQQFLEQANSMDALTQKADILARGYEAQAKKIEVCQKALEESAKKEEKAAERVEKLKEEFQKASEKMKEMEQSSETTAEELKEQSKHVEELSEQLKRSERSYERAEDNTNRWRTSLTHAEADLLDLNGEIERNERYLEEARNSADHTAASIDEFGNEVGEAAEETSVFGDVLKANLASEVIIAGIKAVAEGIKEIGSGVISVGKEFDTAMSQTAATIGLTAEEINNGSEKYEKLRTAAKQCGEETKYSASQAGEALNYLALAGYDVDKAVATLPKTLTLATAGGMDLAYATDLVTDSMSSLGLDAEELDVFLDQMAQTSRKSNTSIAQLGEGILTVGGTAKNLSGGITEMNTLLGIFADAGIKASEGGTHLRNIILAMTPTTDAAIQRFKDLGVSSYDINGNLKPLNQTFGELNSKLEMLSKEERQRALLDIFNKTDLTAVDALLSNCNERFDELSGYIKNSTGAAEEMSETMSNNLEGAVTSLGSATEGLGITVYEKFEGSFRSAVDRTTNGIKHLNRELKSGELGKSVDRLAEAFSSCAEGSLNFAEDALPVVINGLTWILENSDFLIAGLSAVGAGMAVNALAATVLSVKTEILKFKTEEAGIAQWALNAAQAASPAGLLITGLAAATAALIVYAAANKESLIETEHFSKEVKNLCKDSEALTKQIKEGREEREAEKKSIETQYGAVKILSDNFYDLAEKTNRTEQEDERLNSILKELNESMPSLNLFIDEQTGKINKNRQETEKLIEAEIKKQKIQAAQKDLTKIAEEQYEAEKKLAELEEELTEATRQQTEYQEKHSEALSAAALAANIFGVGVGNSIETVLNYGNELNQCEENVKNLQIQIESQTQSIGESEEEFEKVANYASGYGFEVEKAADKTKELGQEVINLGGTLLNAAEPTKEALGMLIADYEEAKEKARESIRSQIGLFGELDASCEETIGGMTEDFKQQAEVMTTWGDNLRKAAELGINQGLLQELASAGVDSAGYLAEITSGTQEEIDKMNQAWEERLKAEEYVSEEMAGIETGVDTRLTSIIQLSAQKAGDMSAAGSDFAKGFGEGFQISWDGEKGTAKVVLGKVGALVTDIKSQLDIHSPSKVMEEIGVFTGEGFRIGAEKSFGNAAGNIHNIISSIKEQEFSVHAGNNEYGMPDFSYVSARAYTASGSQNRGFSKEELYETLVKAFEDANIQAVITTDSAYDAVLGRFRERKRITGRSDFL